MFCDEYVLLAFEKCVNLILQIQQLQPQKFDLLQVYESFYTKWDVIRIEVVSSIYIKYKDFKLELRLENSSKLMFN